MAPDQRQLLDVVSAEFITTGTWPTFQFVDKTLDGRGVDIDSVLETMVTGLVVIRSSGGAPPRQADPVSLTITGLAKAGATEVVQDFFEMVVWLVKQESSFAPANSADVEDLSMSAEQVRRGLSPYRHLGAIDLVKMKTLLHAAPAIWTGMSDGSDGNWEIGVSRHIRQYRSVTTSDELAIRMMALNQPRAVPATVSTPGGGSMRPAAGSQNRGSSHRSGAEHLAQLHDRVVQSAERLFDNGHYAESVFASFKAVEARVGRLSGIDQSGKKLMGDAFGGDKPLLALNDLSTRTNRAEQEGFRLIFMGVMLGIRNQEAHGEAALEDPERALHCLAVSSLLMHRLDDVESRKNAQSQEAIEGQSDATAGHIEPDGQSSAAAESRTEP